MRVTREQAVRTRERILDAAAQLFRERGFDGIGVADLAYPRRFLRPLNP
jgi:TetR/AcrR family transcriptional repressor of nem operon